MRIGVFFNCQCQGIANALTVLLPGSQVIAYARNAVRGKPVEEIVSALRSCDLVICAPGGRNFSDGPLSSDSLRAAGCKVVVVPHVTFSGFHPDTIDGTPSLTQGVTAAYHSRLNIIGFLAGLSIADTVALFNGMVFRRLNYFDYYRVGETFLAGCFGQYGIDIAPYLARWKEAGVFMHTPNHPKVLVTCDLAEIACTVAGIGITGSRHAFDLIPDSLSRYPRHPVFPEIARGLGVDGHTLFMPESHPEGRGFGVVTLPEFIARQFVVYADADRATMLAADGVRSGLEALGLKDRVADFTAAEATPAGASISLSGAWHPPEHWAGDVFRWVSTSGTITLLARKDGTERINLEVEPGPGVAELPLEFDVVDEHGCQLLTALLHGRQTLAVDVQVHANQKTHLQLRARNGGRGIPDDPRVLDFRVFRIDRALASGAQTTSS